MHFHLQHEREFFIVDHLKNLEKEVVRLNSKFNDFLVRWCIEYIDGSKKYGMWAHPGPNNDLHTKAWANNKNIAYAMIERKDLKTSLTKVIVRCSKDEFLNFQWISVAKYGFKMSNTTHQIVGLTLLSTKCSVDCYIDGTISKNDPRNLNINFETFGK